MLLCGLDRSRGGGSPTAREIEFCEASLAGTPCRPARECRVALVCAFLVIAGCGRRAGAETLEQALTDAYLINPVLNAERARLRATDEQVALAKSGLRPLVSGSADVNFRNTNVETAGAAGGAIGSFAGAGVTHPR